MRSNLSLGLIAASVAMMNFGCAPPEQVQNYKVKREAQAPTGTGEGSVTGDYQIIGALFPVDNPVWYFKAGGTSNAIQANEVAIDQFLASLQFTGGPETPPTWKLPEGWKEVPKRAMTYAVLQFGTGDKAAELTVSQVGGGMKANLDRWAGQLGMKPEEYQDLNKYLAPLKAGSLQGYRVKMAGPNNPATQRGPFMGGK